MCSSARGVVGEISDFTKLRVGLRHVGVVAGTELAGFRRVDKRRRKFCSGRFVPFEIGPRDMRLIRADEKAERPGTIAFAQEPLDECRAMSFVGDVKSMSCDIHIAVCDLAKRRSLVADPPHHFWQRDDVIAFEGVIGLRTIAGGHQSREQAAREGARRRGWRERPG